MRLLFIRLARCRRAATAVEYGLIVALIVVAVIGGVSGLGGGVSGMWQTWADKFVAAG